MPETKTYLIILYQCGSPTADTMLLAYAIVIRYLSTTECWIFSQPPDV
jgi:hypothetical protein